MPNIREARLSTILVLIIPNSKDDPYYFTLPYKYSPDIHSLSPVTIAHTWYLTLLYKYSPDIHTSPFLRKFVLVFFDGILIYSSNITSNAQQLQEVFSVLIKNQLVLNQNKCSFAVPAVEYLGHIVSKHGVSEDPKETAAMLDWPVSMDVKALRGFLGLIGYHRFVWGYGSIAKPLTELAKKNAFLWNDEAQAAFIKLKHIMADLPTLAVPDSIEEFVIETDASSSSLGVVLSQKGHPIPFLANLYLQEPR